MKIALVGNPNSGKTTLFNNLTGSTAHVGNWPGVTIEKKSGFYKNKLTKEKTEIIDLPGIYSLSPYSPEEIISRNYILDEKPDAVINIVDGTNPERNLYLTTQLMEMDIPLIVALNMMDVVEKNGDSIDISGLSNELGLPVYGISASKGTGVAELMNDTARHIKEFSKGKTVIGKGKLAAVLDKGSGLLSGGNTIFNTVKLIEGDELAEQKFPDAVIALTPEKNKIDLKEYENDFEALIADLRYKYISEHCSKFFTKTPKKEFLTKSDKIDRVLTHRIWGIPIFLGIMFLVFHLTFSSNFLFLGWFGLEPIGSPGVLLQEGLGWVMGLFIDACRGWLGGAPVWVEGLICDGLLSGLDAVLSFLPQILLLFLFLSILEESGYMSRVAFILDRAFRRFGLSGKAFMPLIMCFGCAVPGIMATRTLENPKERRMAVMIAPFLCCGAKLPIMGIFASFFFPGNWADFIVFGMYVLGIAVAILSAILLRKTFLKGETPPFIMELPAYHAPKFKNTILYLWKKLKHYLVRAATIIAASTVVIWFLSSFSFTFQYVPDSGDSMLGIIGKGLSWLFVPLGFGMGAEGWKFVVAVFTGLIAKEVVVSTLGVFSGMDGDPLEEGVVGPLAVLLSTLSVPAALSFMAFNLLSVPCMAAVGAASGELRKARHTWGAVAYWFVTAYVVSAVIYWSGTYWQIGLAFGLVLIALIAAYIIYRVIKRNKKQKADNSGSLKSEA